MRPSLPVLLLTSLAAASPAIAAAPPAKVGLCASCHGEAGRSPYPTYPNIAGQNAGYIAYAIGQYRQHRRMGQQADVMSGIAAQLTPAEISALAAYYASLKP
jgi:cytochrome c553